MNPTTVEEVCDIAAQVEREDFAFKLTDSATCHNEWLVVVRFGLPTLLADQKLLAEIIAREAEREAVRHNADRVTGLVAASEQVGPILARLGLKLTLA